MRKAIRIEKSYPHPQQRVWRALTDSQALGEWLMPNDFEPVVGHRFQFRTDPAPGFDGIVHCEVLELDPPRKLAFSWKGGPVDTVVTLELASTGQGTHLTMVQTGFRGLRGRLVGWMLKSGGESLYGKKLPALLDRWAEQESAQGAAASAAPDPKGEDEACMAPGTRRLARLSTLGLKRK